MILGPQGPGKVGRCQHKDDEDSSIALKAIFYYSKNDMAIKTKLIILVIVFVLFVGGGIFLYLIINGKIKIGAEAVVGCQNSKKISAFLGSPGARLTSYNFFGNEISVHEMLIPYLDNIQKEIKDKKINYDFADVQSYNNRSKRGGGRSLHSWGIALDVNPDRNSQRGPSDIPPEVIDIFKKNGFFWGGDWGGRDNDPMHFEWYGSSMAGEIVDKISSQKVISVATAVNGAGSPNSGGDYYWIMPYGTYNITSKARGYKETSFPVTLGCFSDESMNIAMEPLDSNVPGVISGKVMIAGSYPILIPANIYLDGRLVSTSTLRGDYTIPNVKAGKHQVIAKIMFFPGGATTIEVVPGDNLKDINIIIGK